MKDKGAVKRWLWWLSLIAAAILIYRISFDVSGVLRGIGSFISIFTPFIIGFAITFLLYAPCNRLELRLKRSRFAFFRKGARGISLVVCYAVFFAIIAGLLTLLLPALYSGISSFITSLPDYYADLSARLAELTKEGGFLSRFDLSDNLKSIYDSAYNMLLSLASTENMLTVVRSAMSVTSTVLSIIMAVIVSIYMLLQREALLSAIKRLLDATIGSKAMRFLTDYAHRTAAIFYSYLYGAAVDACIVAVLMVVGLSLFRLPRSVLLGCFIGFMNLIPYFGAIISGALVILVALLTKNIYTAIGVAVYILVIQQLDGNIIQPKIIVCLGRIAAMRLIRPDFKISCEHGQFTEKGGILFTALYHPSALLRDETKRPDTFSDLKALQSKVREVCTRTL